MDVANRLARLQERTPEQWLRAANTVLPVGVTAILVVALAWRVADLTWSILPGERADDPFPEIAALVPATGSANSIPPVTLDALSDAHLFGEPAAPPADTAANAAVADADAPDTTLNLVLAGVVAREPGSQPGQAIILSGNRQQKVYSVGNTIDGANGARLHSVLADRVLLNRSGRLEALRLPRELPAQAQQLAPRIAPRPLFGGGTPDNPATLGQVIGANAARISDVIRIAPAIDSGQVVGFRVNPGTDAAAFTALGLEPGDIVTEVNGTVIDDPNRGLQVFEALGETTMANVKLLRNGNPQAVVIDTSQLLQIAE